MAKKLQVTLTRSVIGKEKSQRKIVETLGLKRVNHSVVLTDNEAIRGMIDKISHLVSVEEV